MSFARDPYFVTQLVRFYALDALYLFSELRISSRKPDFVLVAIAFGSCAGLLNSLYRQEMHSYVIRLGLELDIRGLLCPL